MRTDEQHAGSERKAAFKQRGKGDEQPSARNERNDGDPRKRWSAEQIARRICSKHRDKDVCIQARGAADKCGKRTRKRTHAEHERKPERTRSAPKNVGRRRCRRLEREREGVARSHGKSARKRPQNGLCSTPLRAQQRTQPVAQGKAGDERHGRTQDERPAAAGDARRGAARRSYAKMAQNGAYVRGYRIHKHADGKRKGGTSYTPVEETAERKAGDARAEGGFYGGKDFHADIIFARRRGISAGLTLPCGTRTRKL